jgi:hypothetical protein
MLSKISIVTLVLVVFFAWCNNSANAQAFVTDGLIGFWSLDKSTIDGDTVNAVIGDFNGTMEGGPKSVDGVINEGMEFDGAGARIELSKDLMVGLEEFTIECWFNYANSSNWRWMFGGGPEWNHGVGCCIYSGNNIVRYHLKTNQAEFTNGDGLTRLNTGEWYHIAYTYDGSTARSYVNGELDFERAHAGAVAIDTSVLAIGAGYWQNNEYFAGILDEVRVYDRALDQDEAKQNYGVQSNRIAVDAAGKLVETWGGIKR